MKSKKIIFLLVLCLLLGACQKNIANENKNNTDKTAVGENKIKAVWINYSELDEIIKSSENTAELTQNINKAVLNCKNLGLNRIIVHSRAFADAYYASSVFPEADSLKDKIKADGNFDPLKIFCETAHENGIKVDSWINPYRVSYSSDTNALPENSAVKKMITENGGKDVSVTDGGIFFNPASLKAQKLILDGVREILQNYDVDGIHIDDYFYPTTDESFDKASYDDYVKAKGKLKLDDWRRENVNNLVSQLYSAVKSQNSELMFSISPCGDIDKNYYDYFADVELWCSQKGYADCIIVQAYYGFENEKLPFEEVVGDWEKLAKNGNIELCFGLACYKSGSEDSFAGKGVNEWKDNDNIISRQIAFLNGTDNCSGVCLYSYSSLFAKNRNIGDNELKNIENVL